MRYNDKAGNGIYVNGTYSSGASDSGTDNSGTCISETVISDAKDPATKKKKSRKTIPAEWKEILGHKCANCGSEEDIEYHHIVPLCVGGTDRITNIVALCHACHAAAHNGRDLTEYRKQRGTQKGKRPPKCDDETAYRALDLLAAGEIGIRKCQQLMNLKRSTQPRATSQYAAWCADRGIADIRNHLDSSIINAPTNVKDGFVIGYIRYLTGEKKNIIFHDTGANSDIEYVFRGCYDSGPMTFEEYMRQAIWRGRPRPKANIRKDASRKVSPPDLSGKKWWDDYRKAYLESVV